jgi:hypothetical protein
MKARDYYDKYRNGITSYDNEVYIETMNLLFQEMYAECRELIKKRNVKTDSGTLAIFQEMNLKCNVLRNLAVKQDGYCNYKVNFFKYILKEHLGIDIDTGELVPKDEGGVAK